MVAYVDSDWAGDEVDRKSTAGTIVFYKGCPVAWGSKKVKSTVSLSSTEAEIHAIVDGLKSMVQLQPVIQEMGYDNPEFISTIIGDNLPAMQILKGSKSTKRAKHFDVKVKFAMDSMERDVVGMLKVRSGDNIADPLTKPSATPWFREFRGAVMAELSMTADALSAREISFVERFGKCDKQSGEARDLYFVD